MASEIDLAGYGDARVIHLPKLRPLIEPAITPFRNILFRSGNNPRATQFAYSEDF